MMTTNKYAGVCVRCGFLVPAGEGELIQSQGRWVVRCDESECGSYDRYLNTVHPFSDEGLGQL